MDACSYTLEVETNDEGVIEFTIWEGTRDHGDDCAISSEEPDEIAFWITELLESKEDAWQT